MEPSQGRERSTEKGGPPVKTPQEAGPSVTLTEVTEGYRGAQTVNSAIAVAEDFPSLYCGV